MKKSAFRKSRHSKTEIKAFEDKIALHRIIGFIVGLIMVLFTKNLIYIFLFPLFEIEFALEKIGWVLEDE